MDNMNVNLWDFGLTNDEGEETLLALSDSLQFMAVGKYSLNTSHFAFDNLSIKQNGTLSSAHPVKIPNSKDTVNFYTHPGDDNGIFQGESVIELYR